MTQSEHLPTLPANELPTPVAQPQELLEQAVQQIRTQPAQAIDTAHAACKLAIEMQSSKLLAASLLVLGLAYTAAGDPASARASFERAEKQYVALPPAETGELLLNFTRSCDAAGDYDMALEYSDRTIDFCRTYGLRIREAECLNKTGIIHARHHNHDLAMSCFREALAIGEELDKPLIRANAWVNFGNIYRMLGDAPQALEYFSKGLVVASTVSESTLTMVCLNNIGIIYAELGEFSDALEYFLRCEMYLDAKGIAEDYSYTNTVDNIGNLYEKLRNYEKALEYQQKALAIRRRTGDKRSEAASLHNLGVTYLAIHNYEKAFESAAESIAIREALGDPSDLALSLNCMGNVLDETGKHDEAISYHLRSIALADKNGDRMNRTYFLISLGSAYLHKGAYDQALECIRQGLTMAEELGAKAVACEARQELARTYRALGDYKTAMEQFELFHSTEREIFNDINSQKVRNLQTLHQVEQTRKEAEIYRLKNVELATAFKELEEANKELQAVNAEKNELMNIVAHDLKNPLSSIMMLADILRNDPTLTSEEIMDFSGNILTSSERMFNLITNLLDVNAIENRLNDLHLFAFDVVPVVQYTARQFQSPAEKKHISLHETYEHASIAVLAEDDALLQVLDNIVSNAIKFSPEGKNVWLTVRNAPSAENGTPAVRIEVRDEGPGLTEDDKAMLFRKFTPLSAQPTGGEHSTGLGLSIVKRLIESMNGNVWCESEPGTGATFVIELPASTLTE